MTTGVLEASKNFVKSTTWLYSRCVLAINGEIKTIYLSTAKILRCTAAKSSRIIFGSRLLLFIVP